MLIDFLSDTMTNMFWFQNDIQTVFLFHENGQVIATGNHRGRLLFYRVEPRDKLGAEIEAPAYLGALPYLSKMLSSALMKEDPRIELKYRMKNEKRVSVESIRFVAKRFESNFQCTNPDIFTDKDRVRQFGRPDTALFFPITQNMRKEFQEVSRFGTPKADIRLFTLDFDGANLRARFGGGTHASTLILSTSNDLTGSMAAPFSRLVSLDRFFMMLKLASENGDAKGGFHPNAVWVDFTTITSLHTIATSTIREQR